MKIPKFNFKKDFLPFSKFWELLRGAEYQERQMDAEVLPDEKQRLQEENARNLITLLEDRYGEDFACLFKEQGTEEVFRKVARFLVMYLGELALLEVQKGMRKNKSAEYYATVARGIDFSAYHIGKLQEAFDTLWERNLEGLKNKK